MKNGAKTPGLFLLATAVVAFVICLGAFAHGTVAVGVTAAVEVTAAVVTLFAAGAGFAWLGMESRRIRHVQRHWSDAYAHPNRDAD
jgi:hypothetical protein